MELGPDLRLDGAMGVELFRAHIHLQVAADVVDAAALRESVRPRPPAEALQVPGRGRDAERLLDVEAPAHGGTTLPQASVSLMPGTPPPGREPRRASLPSRA